MLVGRSYRFEAAHHLPKVPRHHKCARMHGHNYKLNIIIEGPVRDDGMVIDFFDLDKCVEPLLAEVDHQILNNVEGLANPTAENIAIWFRNRLLLCEVLPGRPTVIVYENDDCWAEA